MLCIISYMLLLDMVPFINSPFLLTDTNKLKYICESISNSHWCQTESKQRTTLVFCIIAQLLSSSYSLTSKSSYVILSQLSLHHPSLPSCRELASLFQ